MKISSLIYNRRIELGLTQQDLSRKLGLESPQFISNLERGKALLPLGSVKKLSRALDVEYEELSTMAVNEKVSAMRKKASALEKRMR